MARQVQRLPSRSIQTGVRAPNTSARRRKGHRHGGCATSSGRCAPSAPTFHVAQRRAHTPRLSAFRLALDSRTPSRAARLYGPRVARQGRRWYSECSPMGELRGLAWTMRAPAAPAPGFSRGLVVRRGHLLDAPSSCSHEHAAHPGVPEKQAAAGKLYTLTCRRPAPLKPILGAGDKAA